MEEKIPMTRRTFCGQTPILEDRPRGYPRLAAFLALDEQFTLVKRFDYLHMRSILEQQDELAEMEEQLLRYDNDETDHLNLSSRRDDENEGRRHLMLQLRKKLKDYDVAIQRFSQIRHLPEATWRQKQSVDHWFQAVKPIAPDESAIYAQCFDHDDLVSLAASEVDRAALERTVDMLVRWLPGVERYFSTSEGKTRDRAIKLFPAHFLTRAAKAILALFMPLWLIVPTMLLYLITDQTARAIIFMLFTILTSLLVVASTTVTKSDLILALVTYTAMLGAFLASESE